MPPRLTFIGSHHHRRNGRTAMSTSTDTKQYPVTHTDAEWHKILTPEQFHIMREHGTERPGSCALNYEKRAGTFYLRRLRPGAVRLEEEVRERHRLAELQRSGRRSGRDHDRPQLRHGPHRGALQPLRQPSRPRLRGRPAADPSALLHQRRGDEFQAGVKLYLSPLSGRGITNFYAAFEPHNACWRSRRPR